VLASVGDKISIFYFFRICIRRSHLAAKHTRGIHHEYEISVRLRPFVCVWCVKLLTIFSCRPAKLLTTINSPTGLSRPRLHHVVGQRLRAFLCHTKTNDSFYVWRWHMVYGLILLFGLTGTTPHARAQCTGIILA